MATLIRCADGVMIEVAKKSAAQPVADTEADKIQARFETAMRSVHGMLRPLHESLAAALTKSSVSKAEVKLGLAFTAEGSLFFTKASAAANLEFTLYIDVGKESSAAIGGRGGAQ